LRDIKWQLRVLPEVRFEHGADRSPRRRPKHPIRRPSRLIALRLGNGASVTRHHHEDGLLAGQDVGGQVWPSSTSLEHDASGNVITRTRISGNTRSTSYGYDALNRLVSEAGPAATQGFVLDANGNRLSDGRGSKSYQPQSNRLQTLDG